MERRVDSNALEALQTYKARNTAQGAFACSSRLTTSSFTSYCPTVQILFKAVGNVPVMRHTTFKVTVSNRSWVAVNFLKGKLGWKAGEPLVVQHSSSIIVDGKYTFVAMLINQLCTSVHTYQPRLPPCSRRHSSKPIQGMVSSDFPTEAHRI